MKILFAILLILAGFCFQGDAATYYAATNGSSGNSGAIGSPWDMQTAIGSARSAGDTIYLRGGTYNGIYTSALVGSSGNPISVLEYPGEEVVVDGYVTTTLSSGITNVSSSMTVASANGFQVGGVVVFMDNFEHAQIASVSGTTIGLNRGWNGTTAASHSGGATLALLGNCLTVSGDYTYFYGLEITNSDTDRVTSQGGSSPTDLLRGWNSGIFHTGTGNRFIGCTSHDNGNGVFDGSSGSGSYYIDCVFYNNGWNAPDRNHGHGIYIQNLAVNAKKYLINCVSFNNYGHSMQIFSSSNQTAHVEVDGGAFFGGNIAENNGIVVYGNDVQDVTLKNLNQYNEPIVVGQDAVNPDITVTDNYFAHTLGGTSFAANVFDNFTFTGNTVIWAVWALNITPHNGVTTGFLIDNNHYYRVRTDGFTSGWYVTNDPGGGNTQRTYAQWLSATAFDDNSDNHENASSSVATFPSASYQIRSSSYISGRSLLVVRNWGSGNSISVNLSGAGWGNGQTYTIKNAQSGVTIASGTYNAASPTISLSMNTDSTRYTRTGDAASTPASSMPEFGVFIGQGGAGVSRSLASARGASTTRSSASARAAASGRSAVQ